MVKQLLKKEVFFHLCEFFALELAILRLQRVVALICTSRGKGCGLNLRFAIFAG